MITGNLYSNVFLNEYASVKGLGTLAYGHPLSKLFYFCLRLINWSTQVSLEKLLEHRKLNKTENTRDQFDQPVTNLRITAGTPEGIFVNDLSFLIVITMEIKTLSVTFDF